MRSLNWSHAIIGFLIGIAIVYYVRGEARAENSSENQVKVVEVRTE